MNPRQREVLFRFGLAEHFTSPSKGIAPRLEWREIDALIKSGHLQTNGRGSFRLTVAGLKEIKGELALTLGKRCKFACELVLS